MYLTSDKTSLWISEDDYNNDTNKLISEYSFLTEEMHEDVKSFLKSINFIMIDRPYHHLREMPSEMHDDYINAFEKMSNAIEPLIEFSQKSKIDDLKELIKEEKEKFIKTFKRRKKITPKNYAAHDCAIHIGLLLRDVTKLNEFKYYLKDKKPNNEVTHFALEIFKRYENTKGQHAALKFVKLHFQEIDSSYLNIS